MKHACHIQKDREAKHFECQRSQVRGMTWERKKRSSSDFLCCSLVACGESWNKKKFAYQVCLSYCPTVLFYLGKGACSGNRYSSRHSVLEFAVSCISNRGNVGLAWLVKLKAALETSECGTVSASHVIFCTSSLQGVSFLLTVTSHYFRVKVDGIVFAG